MSDTACLMYCIQTDEGDVCIPWSLAFCDLTERGSHSLWFSATGGLCFLSGRHVDVQAGHKDFEHHQYTSPCFFAIVNGSEGYFLYACPGSHYFTFYMDVVRGRLVKTLRMGETTISANSVFIGHAPLSVLLGVVEEVLCTDYLNLTPNEVEVKDATASAYGNGLTNTPKAGAKMGGEDNGEVVETNMSDVRSTDDGHV